MVSRTKPIAFALVSIAVLVQGTAAPVVATTTPNAIAFNGCATLFAAYPVAKDLLVPHLPPGFEPNPFSLLPSNDVGSVPIFFNRCGHGTDDAGAAIGNAFEAWLLIWVQPPAQWRQADLTAYYWVVQGFTAEAGLAQTYSDWGIGPVGTGDLLLERVNPGPLYYTAWADFASAQNDAMGFNVVNENAGFASAWGGLRARFFGRTGDGTIHAADHRDFPGGTISNIQPSTVAGDGGAAPLDGVHEGLGRTFRWGPGNDSWTFERVTLPPLASEG